MKDRKKRDLLIGLLCLMLVFVGIGYAVLSSTLTINSTSNVAGNWDIKMTYLKKASITGNAVSNSANITSDLTGTVSNTFSSPGDSVTYKVKIENKGNIDAKISIDLPEDDSFYVFSSDLEDDTLLKVNSEFIFQITIKFDEEAEEIPTGSTTHVFSIVAQQDDGEGIERISGKLPIVKLVNENDNIDSIGTMVSIKDELFYVISSTTTTVTMLSKYNLKVANYIACNEEMCGPSYASFLEEGIYGLQFDWDGYEYGTDGYDRNSFNSQYKEQLEEIIDDDVNEVRLLTKTEAYALNSYDWLHSVGFWLNDSEDDLIWAVINSPLSIEKIEDQFLNYGTRPVVTINKSLFN